MIKFNKGQMIKNKFLIVFLIIPFQTFGQKDSLLTIQQAIEISLKNNFDIRLSSNLNEQQENENTLGNAGMLPNVDFDGTYRHSSNSLKQIISSGENVNSSGVITTNANVDIGATWTIFDGFKMFNTKKKLSELSLLSNDRLKIQIENTLEEVIASYYFIVRQDELLKAIKEELLLSEERVKIADRKSNNGSGSKLNWLQAKTEYNRQKSIQISLETNSAAAKVKLNYLLGRDIEIKFNIEDTVIISYKPTYDELKKSVVIQNTTLNYYKKNQRIAQLGLEEAKSFRWPVIGVNVDYIYSKITNEKGFALLNQTQGFFYGATVTIPLFHGFTINQQIKNLKLDVAYSDISLESVKSKVNAELYNAWMLFSSNFDLLQLEEQNIGYAREVLSISNERYRVGVSNSIEQREAQQIFEEAMKRLADARFNAKISETTLRKLNGELVK